MNEINIKMLVFFSGSYDTDSGLATVFFANFFLSILSHGKDDKMDGKGHQPLTKLRLGGSIGVNNK